MIGHPRTLLACLLAAVFSWGCRENSPNKELIPSRPRPLPQRSASQEKVRLVRQHLQLLDSIILTYARNAHVPGVAYGIVVDGQLIHTSYQGYTNIEKKIPVDSLSAFRIASMTKSFTTMAILKLRDQGRLNLDDPAANYVKEMSQIKYPSEDARPITIRDLLTHRAGFPEDNPFGDRQMGNTDEQLLKLLSDGPSFSNVPGIAYEYSNLGVSILGLVIRNITGQRYEDFIAEAIFSPLGMEHTYWEYSNVPPGQLAHGYQWVNNDWKEEELLHSGSWGAMGGLITTVEDFAKYMSFHLSAWPPHDGPEIGPITRSSVREMHQLWNFEGMELGYKFPSGRPCATASGYGYGLRIMHDCDGRFYVGHGGGLPGFGSYWRIMPDYGLGITIFGNRTYAGFSEISLQVLDTLLAVTGLKPRPVEAAPILEQRKNELVKLLPDWKGAEKSSIFAMNFFMDNSIDSLRKRTTELFTKAGKINSFSRMEPWNMLRGHFIIDGEMTDLRVVFTLSPEAEPRIQDFYITEVNE